MLQIIIFSYNRALQLDTLLSSIYDNWETPNYQINVLYNTSNNDFEEGYNILKEKYKDNIIFYKETKENNKYKVKDYLNVSNIIQIIKDPIIRHPKSNFRNLLIEIIKNGTSPNIMFLTDDSMIIRSVNIDTNILDWINESPFQRQFSIRLGYGMNNQDANNVTETNNILSWNFYRCNRKTNWGYNFSVDGHIYSKKAILKLFSNYVFTNPNSLESIIYNRIRKKGWMSEGKANKDVSILSFPINMVQTYAKNETLGVDCKMMNDWFLSGYTMKYPIPNNFNMFQQYPTYLYLYKDKEIIKKALQ